MSAPIVIVGGGMAAGSAAVELRKSGYDGEVVLFADEAHPPYERPPLSKGYLAGSAAAEDTYLQPRAWYDEHDVDLRTGTPVEGIRLGDQVVSTENGDQPYSRLLLATGASARTLPLASTDELPVTYLRSLEDARVLRSRLDPGARLLVVGGGWIGMEVAATARQREADVVLVEPAEHPLLNVLGPELGGRLAEVHRRHGVDLRTSTSVESLRGRRARLSDGTEIEVDTVVVGVGAIPNDDLARRSGLEVANGIVVDQGLRASDPDVFAAGDVANHAHPVLKEAVRVEHWQNAVGQGRAAARAMLGEPVVYDALPSFFSDQYDLGLEYFGYAGSAGADSVRIDPSGGDDPDALTAWWFRGDTLVAALHINEWDRSEELAERVRVGH